MLVFNEGLPRSGKSYDAFVNHVLPALRAGRKVYARLNGMDDLERRRLIALHLGMDLARLDELLIHVPTIKVPEVFRAEQNSEGQWAIPAHLVDAAFVIDEVHEFYVASRQAIQPEFEQFFALHGQYGMDGVVMTQWLRRLHSSVRSRIERKNVFQKLTAVGMETKFTVRRYHAVVPEKFELVTTETGIYDPVYFPLYKGYADGATQKGVYKSGGVTVWKKLRRYGLVMLVVVGLGLFFFLRIFSGDGGMVKSAPRVGAAPRTVSTPAQQAVPVAAPSLPISQHPGVDTKGMPPEVAYLFDMSGQARARLAALATGPDGQTWGVIEWREDQGHVLEVMNLDQVRDLGLAVQVHTYGVKLTWKDRAILVTAWPLDMQGTVASEDRGGDSRQAPLRGPSAAPDGQDAGKPTDWGREPIVATYTPPELVKAPERSTWKPGG